MVKILTKRSIEQVDEPVEEPKHLTKTTAIEANQYAGIKSRDFDD